MRSRARTIGIGRRLGVGPCRSRCRAFPRDPRLPSVYLKDHLVCEVEPGLVVADRGGGDKLPIRGDPGNLNERDVEMAEEALPHHLGDMGEVDVDVLHLAA